MGWQLPHSLLNREEYLLSDGCFVRWATARRIQLGFHIYFNRLNNSACALYISTCRQVWCEVRMWRCRPSPTSMSRFTSAPQACSNLLAENFPRYILQKLLEVEWSWKFTLEHSSFKLRASWFYTSSFKNNLPLRSLWSYFTFSGNKLLRCKYCWLKWWTSKWVMFKKVK